MIHRPPEEKNEHKPDTSAKPGVPKRKLQAWFIFLSAPLALCIFVFISFSWLRSAASEVRFQLDAAATLIPSVREDVSAGRTAEAKARVTTIREHTAVAREVVEQPLWTLSSAVPFVGHNLSAIAEVARSADDIATLGLLPLVTAAGSMDWNNLVPNSSGSNLEPLANSSSAVTSAAYAVRESADRLNAIEIHDLLPRVAEPIALARGQLNEVTSALDTAADVSKLAPAMLGNDNTRQYLLLIQNNAEARATGGIPGALALLKVTNGQMTIQEQTSAGALGAISPAVPLDPVQEQIYSPSMGTTMQDVNMTPDFPSAAETARKMWEQKSGDSLDGVLSVDPVALSYVLGASGPVELPSRGSQDGSVGGLTTQLSAANVVETLLSDVYAEIPDPSMQDAYFASSAQEIFKGVSSGGVDPGMLLTGLSRAVLEGRILLWSASSEEQSILAKYAISGSISGPSTGPAEFGIYFNDGTGAKMDYYVKRTVQLIEQCSGEGYREVKVRVVSTNNAPEDAATALAPYVTGDGIYGVPPGSVQTNVVAYGPVQSNITTAFLNGVPKAFAAQRHDGRPVGTITTRLEPGESSTIDFTFTKIVQNSELELDVTPSVQPLEDVVLESESKGCKSPG